ncbi:MAG: hypothetical protein U9O94_10560 [Nanoarchaeota archaeon]|nr:hypothetical protein [Nanoarchaeota archaeon]
MGALTKIWYILLFALIIGLSFYDRVWIEEYTSKVSGTDIKTQHFGKIINISEDHFYLDVGSSNIRIESSNISEVKKAKYGETVVHIIIRQDGTIEGINYHNYDYNYFLYFISFVAILIFLIILLKEWRLTFRKDCLFDNKQSKPPH